MPNVTVTHLVPGNFSSGSGGGGGGGIYGGGGGASSAGGGVTRVDSPVFIRADITYLRLGLFRPATGAAAAGACKRCRSASTTLCEPGCSRRGRLARAPAGKPMTWRPTHSARRYCTRTRELTGRDARRDDRRLGSALYPGAELEARTGRLSLELLAAAPERREVLIARYRDAKGVAYTDALAAAIPRLPAEAQKKAREALAARLTRMTPKTMRRKLADDDTEVRRAAVEACQRLGEREFVPDLAGLLDDGEPAIARAAGQALRSVTGREFATLGEWREWWEKRQGE